MSKRDKIKGETYGTMKRVPQTTGTDGPLKRVPQTTGTDGPLKRVPQTTGTDGTWNSLRAEMQLMVERQQQGNIKLEKIEREREVIQCTLQRVLDVQQKV